MTLTIRITPQHTVLYGVEHVVACGGYPCSAVIAVPVTADKLGPCPSCGLTAWRPVEFPASVFRANVVQSIDVPVEHRLSVHTYPDGSQILITHHVSGRVTFATRPDRWATWGPPTVTEDMTWTGGHND